jgi:cytoplasmic iron level regulating protein YaaA (DUF328/UPF0246 family)
VSKEIIILLPPSEGKTQGGVPYSAPGVFDRGLKKGRAEVRRALLEELRVLTKARAEKLFKARGELLERAIGSAAALKGKKASTLPAWQRYSGVVWTHLDPGSLTEHQRSRILVPSGLYGLTSASDAIVDYRLTMGVSLRGIGNLAAYWRDAVTGAIETRASDGLVVDILPREHRAAIDHDRLRRTCDLVIVEFVRQDGRSAAGHGAKAAKGVLAHALFKQGEAALGSFGWEGWQASREGAKVYVREPRSAG